MSDSNQSNPTPENTPNTSNSGNTGNSTKPASSGTKLLDSLLEALNHKCGPECENSNINPGFEISADNAREMAIQKHYEHMMLLVKRNIMNMTTSAIIHASVVRAVEAKMKAAKYITLVEDISNDSAMKRLRVSWT